MKKLTVLFLLFSTICYTQSYRVEGLTISTKEDITSIYFKNGNSDGFYLDGEFIESYGVLKLSIDQFKQFIEDNLKASKKSSIDIQRDLYSITRFDFSEDEIYFNVKDKVGTITKKQLKEIIKQNNL